MKKHYDTKRLTDELSKSVFFQQPEEAREPNESNQTALAPKHQVTKALKLQSARAPSNQPTKDTKQESTKAPSNQSDKEAKQQSTLALKHFSSYLEPETYKEWKLLATQREKKDYEILQEALDMFITKERNKE